MDKTELQKNYEKLDDEELVLRYQKDDELGVKEVWNEILDRFGEQLRKTFRSKCHYWKYESDSKDLYNAVFQKALERDILMMWEPGGLSVKNWIFTNFLNYRYLPSKTDIMKWEKEGPEKVISADEIPERSEKEKPFRKYRLSLHAQHILNETEKQAEEFLDFLLNDEESSLTSSKKEGRRKVLKVLKVNYDEGKIFKDSRKAKEANMSKASFSNRKSRALDDIINQYKEKRPDYRPEILLRVGAVFGYQPGTIDQKVRKLKRE